MRFHSEQYKRKAGRCSGVASFTMETSPSPTTSGSVVPVHVVKIDPQGPKNMLVAARYMLPNMNMPVLPKSADFTCYNADRKPADHLETGFFTATADDKEADRNSPLCESNHAGSLH